MYVNPEPGAFGPSGTVTFAFTDIEGSTVRWERDRLAMGVALRRHDEIVRAAIVGNGGVVFKTVGDAFCSAFARPEHALAAMLEAQHALARENFSAVDGLRVRAAVHTGTADERGGDYFGPTVNRVARLLATGHGGQVLVSNACAELVRAALPEASTLRDLGEHRLKDLARPERVFQLSAPGLVDVVTPLRSLDARPNNLPRELTSFVGREREVADVAALLERHALVTLVGSGGIGKTRASLHVAAQVSDAFPDGVWLVELAPVASGEYVASTIAQAARVPLAVTGDPLRGLVAAFGSASVLLVLDNCEHLVDACAATVSAFLQAAPNVKILATSRQGLGVRGEETYRISPLTVPHGEHAGAALALESPAVVLFVERARAVDKRFELTDDNAAAVVDICRRLDGIALAIELAAVRVKILAPSQLRDRLDERFRMLTGGSRDVLPRQQTLRALIDWSFDLLDERERTLFRRLGTFADGCTLESATAVCADAALDEFEIFDALATLVDKSLVLADMGGDEPRYRLFESMRAYAREKLALAGELEACDARRLRYFAAVATAKFETFNRTGHRVPLMQWFASELEDIRASLDDAFDGGGDGVAVGCELLVAVSWDLSRFDFTEAVARLHRARDVSSGDDLLHARLSCATAKLELELGRFARAVELSDSALAVARRIGNVPLLADALLEMGFGAARRNDGEAVRRTLEELEEVEALEPLSTTRRRQILELRANFQTLSGDFEEAFGSYERLRAAAERLGDHARVTVMTLNLAELAHRAGRVDLAIEEGRRALLLVVLEAKQRNIAEINLTGYLAFARDPEALVVGRRFLARVAASSTQFDVHLAIALEHVALALARAGDVERAAMLEGYAAAGMTRDDYVREWTEQMSYDAVMAMLREHLDGDALAHALAAGAALTRDAALALAAEPIPPVGSADATDSDVRR